jgi:ADP-ribose pyrophosphatase YjhB (NUDIX family)
MTDLGLDTDQGAFTYRVAALIIHDGRLLMVKHVDHPCYYTVGGRVRFGETSREAVMREALEETGLAIEIDRLAFVQERFFELADQRYHEIAFFYLMRPHPELASWQRRCTDQGPRETLHWLPLAELARNDVVPAFLKDRRLDSIAGIEHIVSRED